MMWAIMLGSMLPPQSGAATTRPSISTLPARRAATPAAPAPSTTVFSDSSRSKIARAISSSLTGEARSYRLRLWRHGARVLFPALEEAR